MLCDFGSGGRVNDPQLGADDDVGDGGIYLRVAESHGRKAGTVDDVLDLEFRGGFLESLDRLGESGLVRESDERDVIGLDERRVDAGGGPDERGVDLAIERGVDGRLAMLGRYDYQGIVVDVLGFERRDDLAKRVVNEIEGFEQGWCEVLFGAVGVTDCLLAHGYGLEISAEEGRSARETFALKFRVVWSFTLDPVQEGVHMKLVVADCRVDCNIDRSDFRKVANGETFARGAADDVVGGMFIGVGSLLATCFNEFEDGVHAEAAVGVDLLAFAVDDRLGEVIWVDTTREELGIVVVFCFVVGDCSLGLA